MAWPGTHCSSALPLAAGTSKAGLTSMGLFGACLSPTPGRATAPPYPVSPSVPLPLAITVSAAGGGRPAHSLPSMHPPRQWAWGYSPPWGIRQGTVSLVLISGKAGRSRDATTEDTWPGAPCGDAQQGRAPCPMMAPQEEAVPAPTRPSALPLHQAGAACSFYRNQIKPSWSCSVLPSLLLLLLRWWRGAHS